jgi:hypothetical protein
MLSTASRPSAIRPRPEADLHLRHGDRLVQPDHADLRDRPTDPGAGRLGLHALLLRPLRAHREKDPGLHTTSIGGTAQGFTYDDTRRMSQLKNAGTVRKLPRQADT